MAPKRSRSAPAAKQQPAARRARRGSQGAASSEQVPENGAPVVQLAGRTEDPEGVGAELVKLLGGNAAAVRKGIRKTDEVPARYAIPDAVEMIKGPGSSSREFSRLRAQYPEVFAKERGRVQKCDGAKDPNFIFWPTVRFRDCVGNLNKKPTPVAALQGILDIVVLLPGKTPAELRSQIINVFVRFVGGASQ